MSTFKIVNAKLILPDRVVDGGLEVADGVIRRILPAAAVPDSAMRAGDLDARGGYVAPGFIDTHLHGGGGYLAAETGTAAALRAVVRAHWRHGTTALYLAAAAMQRAQEQAFLRAFVEARREPAYAASLPGVHMEGPYLSQAKAGAHAHTLLRMASLAELDQWQAWSNDAIRLITVAYEADPDLTFIREAARRGIRVLLGHTDCTYEEALRAFAAGANRVTHLFNAMSALHHRKPGVVGAALSEDDVWVELIADGYHVHPAVLKMVVQCKPRTRLVAVTDCLTDYQPGTQPELVIGGAPVHYEGKGFFALENGTMAGSALTMERAVAHLHAMTPLSLPEAVNCASLNPATDLRIQDRKGSLAVGKDADLVMLDGDWNVVRTLVQGRAVYPAP
jgi:N-acetylglucosamine-6-phosphate deacetylase